MAMSMLELLHPDAVCLGLEAETAAGVIEVLAARLLALGKVKASYAGAVLEREATMPTGLPVGEINVAVPHTDREHVVSPAIALATLRRPVPFGNMEEPESSLDVRVVVALALTDKTAQLEMLASVAALIQDADRLRRLAAAPTIEAVREALQPIKED